jgi:hypothetical protein
VLYSIAFLAPDHISKDVVRKLILSIGRIRDVSPKAGWLESHFGSAPLIASIILVPIAGLSIHFYYHITALVIIVALFTLMYVIFVKYKNTKSPIAKPELSEDDLHIETDRVWEILKQFSILTTRLRSSDQKLNHGSVRSIHRLQQV